MASPERIFPYRGRTPDGPVVPHKAGLGPVTKVLGGRGGGLEGGEGAFLQKGSLSPSNLSYCNSLPSASLTRAGLALPFILRMTCPTKKLMSLVLPPL